MSVHVRENIPKDQPRVLEKWPMFLAKTAQGSPPTDGNRRPVAWSTPHSCGRHLFLILGRKMHSFKSPNTLMKTTTVHAWTYVSSIGQPLMVVFVRATLLYVKGWYCNFTQLLNKGILCLFGVYCVFSMCIKVLKPLKASFFLIKTHKSLKKTPKDYIELQNKRWAWCE